MNLLPLLCLLLLAYEDAVVAYDRTITSHINPGCADCSLKDVNLIYVDAVGDNDTIHNVWDFTRGKPTVLFSVTEPGVNLSVEWNDARNAPEKFTFSSRPNYSFGIVLDKIWEYNDVNNTAVFNPSCIQCHTIDTENLNWKQKDIIQEENQITIKVISDTLKTVKSKGEITIKLDLYPYTSYSFDLPHLIHTANSTLIDIELNEMPVRYPNSRFALEFVVISSETSDKDSMSITTRKGLDDEHTPGVFEIVELVSPNTLKYGNGSFLQYRPISYMNSERDVASSSKVDSSSLNMTALKANTTAYDYFKTMSDFVLLTENFTVSFGIKDDGFYKKTNYTLWCLTVGYGRPPAEGFSLLVILILSIGLGIPLLLLITGGLFVCVRKYRRNQHNVLQEE